LAFDDCRIQRVLMPRTRRPGPGPQRVKAEVCPHPGRQPGAASLARWRCRGRAADAGQLSPLPPGWWRPAITRPLAPQLRTSRGCGWPVQRRLALSRRSRSPSRALPAVASPRRSGQAPSL